MTNINFIIPFRLAGSLYMADCYLRPSSAGQFYRVSSVTPIYERRGVLEEGLALDNEIFSEIYDAAMIEFKYLLKDRSYQETTSFLPSAQINTEVKVTSQSVPTQETQEIEFTPGNPEEYQIDTIMGDDGIPMTPFDPGYWEKLIAKASEINEVKKD